MKGFSVFILALTLVFVVAVKSHATLISSYSEIAGLVNTTVDFEDLGACVASGHQFSFGCGQPYTSIGLTMGVQFPDNVDIGSDSGGISVRSATVYTGGLNNQNFYFTSAQQAVGFYYQDSTANFIEIKAYDDLSNLLETHSLSGGNGYGGFTRDTADIYTIRIFGDHGTNQEAFDSRIYVDDISFLSSSVPVPDPAAVFLLGSACVLGAGLRRKFKK